MVLDCSMKRKSWDLISVSGRKLGLDHSMEGNSWDSIIAQYVKGKSWDLIIVSAR